MALNVLLLVKLRQFRWAEARPKGDCQQEPSHHLDLRPLQAEEEVEGNAIPPLQVSTALGVLTAKLKRYKGCPANSCKFCTQDYFARHPWRAPGSARLYSGCGVAGGNPEGCPPQVPPGNSVHTMWLSVV